jgi:DNA repair exonuclease SbcCD ATPase subunit
MKLIKLRLNNFKGIRSFELDAQGNNIAVYGDNATGKTTLFDAFLWLLFDKDSQNKKDFDIKTLDENGKAYSGLNHEVEGAFEVKGKRLILKKVYTEKWTKKRGSVKPEFTGHTTEYYLDGVPVSKGEYTSRIDEISKEDIFKLLTSPSYFNEQLHWQERRKILLQICGDVSDEDVIGSNPKLAKLPDILQGRKLDDHRKVITSKRAEINRELEKIPVRIDEAMKSLPDITDIDADMVTIQISKYKEKQSDKMQEISRIQSGGEIAEKTRELRELEAQALDLKNKLRSKTEQAIAEKNRQLSQTNDRINDIESQIKRLNRDIEANQQDIAAKEKKAALLRERWHQVNDKQFELCQDKNCPTCGQFLPEEQLEEAREKALAQFNLDKAETLEKISVEGKEVKSEINILLAEKIKAEDRLKDIDADLTIANKEAQNIRLEINQLQTELEAVSNSPEIRKNAEAIAKLQKVIADLQSGKSDEIVKARNIIVDLDISISELEKSLAQIALYKRTQERIEELKAQEKQLATEYEKLEGELYLTEEFIRTKVKFLEKKINDRFKMARFKLFDVQVNGGIQEVCETLYNGVPYSTGLNNAARINVGLDIINTLSEYYGFSAPIFVDNREAVTKLIETKGQVISLVVSELDKKLRVEHENTAELRKVVGLE